MKNILPIITVLLLCGSCINSDYDFDKIPDDMVIGDEVVMPLGKTDPVYLKDLIDIDGVSDIYVDENGGYSFRYKGDFLIENSVPTLEDFVFDGSRYIKTSSFPPISNIPSPIKLKLTDDYEELVFTPTEEIKVVDRVVLKKGTTSFSAELSFTGINIINSTGSVIAVMNMPKGTVMEEKEGVTVDADGMYTYTASFDINDIGAKKLELTVGLLEVVVGDIRIQTFLDIKTAERITFDEKAMIASNYTIKDIEIDVVYGEIDLTESISETIIEIGDIQNLFGEGAILDFYNPMIGISATQNIGMNFVVNLDVDGYKGGVVDKEISSELFVEGVESIGEIRTTDYVLSPLNPFADNVIWNELALNEIIVNNPDKIGISGMASSVKSDFMFIPFDATLGAAYEVVVPFATGADFRIAINEEFKDIFTDEIADMLFKSGSLEFFGVAENTLPLDLNLTVKALDANGVDLGITFETVNVDGSSDNSPVATDIKFSVKESDMNKMYKARSLVMVFNAASNKELEGVVIKESNYIDITLKIRKKGGIVI